MSDTTKGVWHRKEAEPGNFAKGYEALDWSARDAVREMPEAPGSDEAGSQEAA